MYKVDQESDPVEMVVEKGAQLNYGYRHNHQFLIYFLAGDDIRFKVVELEYNDTTPKPADQTGGAMLDTSKDAPFRIVVSLIWIFSLVGYSQIAFFRQKLVSQDLVCRHGGIKSPKKLRRKMKARVTRNWKKMMMMLDLFVITKIYL